MSIPTPPAAQPAFKHPACLHARPTHTAGILAREYFPLLRRDTACMPPHTLYSLEARPDVPPRIAGRPRKGRYERAKLALSLVRETGGSNRRRLIVAAFLLPPGAAKIIRVVYPSPPRSVNRDFKKTCYHKALQSSPYASDVKLWARHFPSRQHSCEGSPRHAKKQRWRAESPVRSRFHRVID